MDDSVLPKLFSILSSACDAVRQHDNVHIFSHHDADGISAAIILARTMIRAGKGFKVTLFPVLSDETMDVIRGCGAGCIIISDMGTSYIGELEKMDPDIIVLDHHEGDPCPKKVYYANPHSFGIDGMQGGCGASMALLFSVQYDERNWDLVQIAFAGITGDKQHQKGLTDINRYIFAEGSKKGYIAAAEGELIPAGRLMTSLFTSVSPYIRGVSGNAGGVTALMKDAGIDASSSSSGLKDAGRRKLSSLIAAKLLAQGVAKETFDDLISVRYSLKDWDVDAEAFASILDSCGRSGTGGAGIGFGLGDPGCASEARAQDESAREKLAAAAAGLDKEGLEEMKNIQFFAKSESGFTGMLCETAMRYIGSPDKPAIGYTTSDGRTKASARCTYRLIEKGVDLSVAMRVAGKEAGGGGGGHKVAAGAWFPEGNEKIFLEAADRIIGEQVSAR